jgi:predicted DNA-binding mobile mystery protein A
LGAARDAARPPARGWLRAVRQAIGITQRRVAEKAGATRQSYAQFEISEAKGSISIGSLRRAAEAMDCELVYFIVPRASAGGSYRSLAAIHDPLAIHMKATEHSMSLGGQGAVERRVSPGT